MLSRVIWPAYQAEQVAREIKGAVEAKKISRACLQVVNKDAAVNQARRMLAQLKEVSQVPVCISGNIESPEEGQRLIEAGADKIGISLDCASEAIYQRSKGGSFHRQLKLIADTAKLIPGRVTTHLIVGLGETEEEMIRVIDQMLNWGVTVGLFAFTPVKGTKDQDKEPPALEQYRRVQAALFLLEHRLAGITNFTFTNGRLTGYGMAEEELSKHLSAGKAFQTTGCPDCNRPYYNEKPGGVIYNYPRPLTEEEIEEALAILGLAKGGGCHEQKVAGD
jgi:biotin synthase